MRNVLHQQQPPKVFVEEFFRELALLFLHAAVKDILQSLRAIKFRWKLQVTFIDYEICKSEELPVERIQR